MGLPAFFPPLPLWPTRCLKWAIRRQCAVLEKFEVWHADRAKMDARIRRRHRMLEKVERFRLELKRRDAGGFYLYDQLRMRR